MPADSYFPLQTGNSWTYRSNGRFSGDVKTIEVIRAQNVDGRQYHEVEFFGRSVLLRYTGDGALVAWDAATRRDRPWFNFAAAERQSFPTEIDDCTKTGRIESRSARHEGPVGSFDRALELTFEQSCADAGVTRMFFLPYVGLLEYETTSIAGPRRYQLIHAKVGLTEVSAGDISSRLSLDRMVYPYARDGNVELLARLAIRNTTDRPLVLNFLSGQRYDLAIRNERDEIVAVWSRDKLFIQALGSETVVPGGERSWVITLSLAGLPPGKYVAEGWVTNYVSETAPRQMKSYAASVGFEIAEVMTQN